MKLTRKDIAAVKREVTKDMRAKPKLRLVPFRGTKVFVFTAPKAKPC